MVASRLRPAAYSAEVLLRLYLQALHGIIQEVSFTRMHISLHYTLQERELCTFRSKWLPYGNTKYIHAGDNAFEGQYHNVEVCCRCALYCRYIDN